MDGIELDGKVKSNFEPSCALVLAAKIPYFADAVSYGGDTVEPSESRRRHILTMLGGNSIRALAKSKGKASTSETIIKNDWASEVMCGAVANDWTKGSLWRSVSCEVNCAAWRYYDTAVPQ